MTKIYRISPHDLEGWTAEDVELQFQELHKSEISDEALLVILRLTRYVQELNDRISELEYRLTNHNL